MEFYALGVLLRGLKGSFGGAFGVPWRFRV